MSDVTGSSRLGHDRLQRAAMSGVPPYSLQSVDSDEDHEKHGDIPVSFGLAYSGDHAHDSTAASTGAAPPHHPPGSSSSDEEDDETDNKFLLLERLFKFIRVEAGESEDPALNP